MRLWSNVRGFCATIWSSRMSSTAASNRRLEGKVAIVTASTDGIGFGIAKQLVRDGAKVMISSRKQDRVSSAVSELENEERGCEVKGVVCHVAKPQHRKNLIEETLQHFGGIDILVSNAAVNPTFGPLLQTPEEAWNKIFDVNVKSAFLLAKDVIPLMEKRGGGSVVFISSIAGYQPMQVEKDQNDISKKVADLNRRRESCHEELSKIKTLISFIMQATTFWEEVIMLANAATVKTEQVEKIVDRAAKKNSVKILSSRGTETKMRSFKESWMEVAEMFASEENKLLLNEKFFLMSQ